jgi:hypothetical protein
MFFALAVSALVRSPRPRDPAAVVVPVMLGLAALRVARLDAFFALSVIGFLGHRLAWLFEAAPRRRVPLPLLWRTAAIALAVGLLTTVPAARRAVTCVELQAPWWPEPEVIAFAQEHRLSGRVVTFFRWGEYGIWHLPKSLKVSMDGRRETVYSNATIDQHLRLYEGQDEGLEYLDALSTDYVWLPRQLPVALSLERLGWVPVFRGPSSVLLARHDLAQRFDSTAGTSGLLPSGRCFPGP